MVSPLACVLTGTVIGDVDGCDPALAPRYLCKIPAGKGKKFQEKEVKLTLSRGRVKLTSCIPGRLFLCVGTSSGGNTGDVD